MKILLIALISVIMFSCATTGNQPEQPNFFCQVAQYEANQIATNLSSSWECSNSALMASDLMAPLAGTLCPKQNARLAIDFKQVCMTATSFLIPAGNIGINVRYACKKADISVIEKICSNLK
jgi:hypothetical protein